MIKVVAALLILAATTWYLTLPLGSFVLDLPLLIVLGIIITFVSFKLLNNLVQPKKSITILFVLTLIIFYFASVSLYFNMPYMDWLHQSAAARYPFMKESPSGFHFMINSGILNIDYVNPADAPFYLHLFSTVFFISYILWLYLGVRLGIKLFDRKRPNHPCDPENLQNS